jgi:prolyl-tRNA synthetase
LRIEIGPKDIQKQQVTVVRRDNGEKSSIPMNTSVSGVEAVLKTIQKSMFDKVRGQHSQRTAFLTPRGQTRA